MNEDQELLDAQERLIRRREEEKTTVQEDLGYQNTIPSPYLLFPRRSEKETSKKLENLRDCPLVRVTYIDGVAKGFSHALRADIADDLIKRGKAVAIDRQPGEETNAEPDDGDSPF